MSHESNGPLAFERRRFVVSTPLDPPPTVTLRDGLGFVQRRKAVIKAEVLGRTAQMKHLCLSLEGNRRCVWVAPVANEVTAAMEG